MTLVITRVDVKKQREFDNPLGREKKKGDAVNVEAEDKFIWSAASCSAFRHNAVAALTNLRRSLPFEIKKF